MGDIFLDLNEIEKAAEHYQQFYEIAESLVAADPHSDKAKGNLAVSLSRIATIKQLKRDLAAARQHIGRALELGQELADHPQRGEVDPSDVQRNLATFNAIMGNVLLQTDPVPARDHFLKAKAIREKLVHQDPNNLTDQRWLAETELALGNVSFMLSDVDAMRDYYVTCVKLLRYLRETTRRTGSGEARQLLVQE